MCFPPKQRTLFRHLNFQKWSEPGMFYTFDLEMCFAPQLCAHFRHLNSQLLKVVRSWCVLYILTWKCATRQNGVHFSTSQLPKVVRTWSFFFYLFYLQMCFAPQRHAIFNPHRPAGSAPAALARLFFDPPEPQIFQKTRWLATFLSFRAPASSLVWLSPPLIFSLLDFSVLTLSISAFPSLHILHIVGSLTSTLPSIKNIVIWFFWNIHIYI